MKTARLLFRSVTRLERFSPFVLVNIVTRTKNEDKIQSVTEQEVRGKSFNQGTSFSNNCLKLATHRLKFFRFSRNPRNFDQCLAIPHKRHIGDSPIYLVSVDRGFFVVVTQHKTCMAGFKIAFSTCLGRFPPTSHLTVGQKWR